ncbi:MAG: sensor histidine kinase, partial [Bacteroidota bacterium]
HIRLNSILTKTYELIEHQMKMANINFYIELNAVKDTINCNENQIKQVCVALLVNASEAVADNGEIVIRSSNPDEEHVRFEVADNGVGISPDDMPHIFQPFYSAKRKASGIGLGLAIVHGIVQSHKGKIEVDSEPGKGTIMAVTLPLVSAAGAANAQPAEHNEA